MPYVNTKEMLINAQTGGYAVGAFNVDNMEMVQAVVWAAEELKAPAIIQTSTSTARYGGMKMYAAMVRAEAEKATVPIALLIDHSPSCEIAFDAMFAGYSTVMIDASRRPIEENIAMTRMVADIAHRAGVTVEAELGRLGGKEEDLDGGDDNGYTVPEEAVYFVEKTAVDSLAVSIGTAHGIYKSAPKLDIIRLSEIRKKVDVPLVLHGASGLTDDDLRNCVAEGICKVNFATEMRQAFSEDCIKYILNAPDTIDPKKYTSPAREAVMRRVMEKMNVLGCPGRA